MKKNLLDFFKVDRCDVTTNKKFKFSPIQGASSTTPPTPATPCTPMTPQTPSSLSSLHSPSSSVNSHDSPSSDSGDNSSSSISRSSSSSLSPQTPGTPASLSSSTASSNTPASTASSKSSSSSTPLVDGDKSEVHADETQKSLNESVSVVDRICLGNTCRNRSQSHPPRQQQQQLYLDFGQASFGSRYICPTCNTLVVQGLVEDEVQHEKICKEFQVGVSFGFALEKNLRVVSGGNLDLCKRRRTLLGFDKEEDRSSKKGCIVEIRSTDCLAWRRKVMAVKRIVEQELGFVGSALSSYNSNDFQKECMESRRNNDKRVPCESGVDDDKNDCRLGNKTFYLYILDKRVVGYCSVEIIPQAYHLYLHPRTVGNSSTFESKNDCEDGGTISRSTEPTKAIMGVHQLWCHKLHRHKGIASQLVDAARSKFVFGMTVPCCWVAFSSPTWDGARFAKRYSHPDPPLVYV